MNENNTLYVLIHSPLVGPLTWSLVSEELRRRGLDVLIPTLKDVPDSQEPFWKQHAQSISQALREISETTPLVLVAHSGAGPLLPAIRKMLSNPVKAYVFVDAGLPGAGASRLDLMKTEGSEWAQQFEQKLRRGALFPTWSMDDLQEILPDEQLRRQMVAELRPRGLNFFTEPIPFVDGWPDAPCIYILFSETYETLAIQARALGWITEEFAAGHFHMLVEPNAVANSILQTVSKVT